MLQGRLNSFPQTNFAGTPTLVALAGVSSTAQADIFTRPLIRISSAIIGKALSLHVPMDALEMGLQFLLTFAGMMVHP
jgi:hypothetical protein